MTKITIYRRDNKIIGYEMDGHSDYADAGFDIYCAAISVLAVNTANSLEAILNCSLKEKQSDGYLKIMLEDEPNEKTQILLESMVLGLNGILENNGKKFLKVNFEEV